MCNATIVVRVLTHSAQPEGKSRKSINNFEMKLVACFVLFDVSMFFLKICHGPATQTDPALCDCFCFVADVNISFKLYIKKGFDDLFILFCRCCSNDHLGFFFLVNRSRLIIHFLLSD